MSFKNREQLLKNLNEAKALAETARHLRKAGEHLDYAHSLDTNESVSPALGEIANRLHTVYACADGAARRANRLIGDIEKDEDIARGERLVRVAAVAAAKAYGEHKALTQIQENADRRRRRIHQGKPATAPYEMWKDPEYQRAEARKYYLKEFWGFIKWEAQELGKPYDRWAAEQETRRAWMQQ